MPKNLSGSGQRSYGSPCWPSWHDTVSEPRRTVLSPFFCISVASLPTDPPTLALPPILSSDLVPPPQPEPHTPPLPPTDGQPRPSSRRSAKSEALSVRLEAMDRCAALLARFVEGPPAGEPRGEGVGQAGLGCEALDCICL